MTDPEDTLSSREVEGVIGGESPELSAPIGSSDDVTPDSQANHDELSSSKGLNDTSHLLDIKGLLEITRLIDRKKQSVCCQ